MPVAKKRDGVRRWWPLLTLLTGGALRAVVTEAYPESGMTAVSMALGCAWAAALFRLLPAEHPTSAPGSAWRAVLAGAMLFGGPLLPVVLLGTVPVDTSGLTVALALTAVVVAVAAAAMSGEGEDVPGRLWPGLAAVGGLLLVLVTPRMNDARADILLVLAPVTSGIGAVWFAHQPGRARWKMSMALVGSTALFFIATGVGWAFAGRPVVSIAAIAWDGVLAGLGVLTLTRLGAVRWSAQFVLSPLLVLLTGLFFVHPSINWRMVLGLVLIAVAGGYLLWTPDAPADTRD